MTAPATPQNVPRLEPTTSLITQLSIGPTFREVASTLLRQHLHAQYPTLNIDPDITMVGTPIWEIVDKHVVAQPVHYQALSDILAKQAVLGSPTLYIEGEHFLTQLPLADPPVHVPVRIDEIASIINLLAPVMLRGYQAQQVDFWNQSYGDTGPHWHELSSALRSIWNVDEVSGWTHDDCVMARKLYHAPNLQDRQIDDAYDTRAYLVDIDQVVDGKAAHLNELLISVLIGKQGDKEIFLSHSLLHGFEKYTSREQMGQSLTTQLTTSQTPTQIQWRLLEPDGNFFDQQACALISIQIEAIGAIDFSEFRETPTPDATPPSAELISSGVDLSLLQRVMPEWLSNASAPDLNNYARYLKNLSALHTFNMGKSYQDDIPSIEQYALEALKAQMLKDHKDATKLQLEALEVVVESLVIWGTFIVPGQVEITTFSLAQLALQNLIALPLGNQTIRHKDGRKLPEWLTTSYLKTVIKNADIGDAYPKLVKSKLLDDAKESARRQQLFSSHLRIQLPLLALQLKIRNDAGIDERGYRYVAAVMQASPLDRQVDGQTIVMRPLALIPKRRQSAAQDQVANMFVIGPRDMASGPCLLYRPLLDQPLTQYPSPANLLYAIQQSASLRGSVLAWLPDAVRTDYTRYVLPGPIPSPWMFAEFLLDPLKLLTLSGPLALSEGTVTGDPFTALYNANANALVDLANRESVSNAEARWATFKRAGWMMLNAALPFFSAEAGAVAWIWQILDQAEDLLDKIDEKDAKPRWADLADLLLNLGMAIALYSLSRGSVQHRPVTGTREKPLPPSRTPIPVKPPKVSNLPDIKAGERPTEHTPSLHTSGALNQTPTRLGKVLDTFKVTKPDGLGERISEAGRYQYLYHSGQKYYAPVGTRWFEVLVDDDDNVVIQDPDEPDHTGPPLIRNRQGNWFVDTRLRLRGGGPKSQTHKAEALAKKRAEELRKTLSDFEKNKKASLEVLQQVRDDMDNTPTTAAEAKRQDYLRALENQGSSYETALQQLKELQVHAPAPDYSQKALGYVKAQLELSAAGIREAQTQFTPKFDAVLDRIEQKTDAPPERNTQQAQEMTHLNLDMIKRIDYVQTRFAELRTLSRDGLLLLKDSKKMLPSYSSEDLKALNVTLARDLCLPQETLATQPRAWTAIDQIIDAADLAVQCLRDTLEERSESRVDERIDSLISLIEQFKMIDERLQDFPEEFSAQAIPEAFQRLREQLNEFNQRAIDNLGVLVGERDMIRTRATPPVTPPRPKKRFINTRYYGVLIGEQRLTEVGLETELVDIRSPLTQKVVATFHEKSPGVWIEHLLPTSRPTVRLDLQMSINAGQTLIDELPAFELHATAQAHKPARTGAGIERLYHQQAERMEQASATIDEALTQSNATESSMLSAAVVRKTLDENAQSLFQEARVHRLRMIRENPPTLSALEWLLRHKLVTIKKTTTRRRLKGRTPDYLDEYVISERAPHKVLWYAQFHYSASWTPDKAFVSARLKTLAEQQKGTAADSVKGMSEEQRTAFYSSEISLAQAQRLFFPTIQRT